MHLRSGKSIASGTTRPSLSTQQSGVGKTDPLAPIIEVYSSSETDSQSTYAKSMATPSVHQEEFLFPICLIYVRNNRLDAKLYMDPYNRLAVKLENAISLPEPYVMVMFQGDRYISATDTTFLLTPSYEDMTPQELVFHRRAETEPIRVTSEPNARQERKAWSEAFPLGSEARQEREAEVSSKSVPNSLSFVPVVRIMIDQENVALYRNRIGLFYSCVLDSTKFCPLENTISVSHDMHDNTVVLKDDHGNHFRIANKEELNTYTWKGIVVLLNVEVATSAHFEIPRPVPSRRTHVNHIATPIVPARAEPIERTFERVHLGRDRSSLPKTEPIGSTIHTPPLRAERIRGKRDEAVKALRPSTL